MSSADFSLFGNLFQPSADFPHLLCFAHNESASNALFLIPGLKDGFMAMKWTCSLGKMLKDIDCALIQVNLKSSFDGFGFSSLRADAEELFEIMRFSHNKWNYKKCFLIGHSTGAQICNAYMQMFHKHGFIDGIIFHSAVSDREAMSMLDVSYIEEMHIEAVRYIADGNPFKPLSKTYFDAPISADRFESLYTRLGKDDMFSTDLTIDELRNIFRFTTCPILFIYGEKDEYVPDQNRLREFSKRLCNVLKDNGCPLVECKFMLANHAFSQIGVYIQMLEVIEEFLKRII